jgi:hypothetical protein
MAALGNGARRPARTGATAMRIAVAARIAAAVALPLMLGACGSLDLGSLNPWRTVEEQPRLPADATEYGCEAGKRLVLRPVQGRKAMLVVFPERTFRLDEVSAGRYSNGKTTLSLAGGVAELQEEGKTTFMQCKPRA